MEKRISYSGIIIILLVVAVVIMAIGFATFSANLTINGTASIKKASWDVAFDEGSYTQTGDIAATGTPSINGTSVTYEVTLTEPGDVFEFTVDVINNGTIDAQLQEITLAGTTGHENYLKFEVVYNGTTYDQASNTVADATVLQSTQTEEFTVRVSYVAPENPDDLPSNNVQATLTATLVYTEPSA